MTRHIAYLVSVLGENEYWNHNDTGPSGGSSRRSFRPAKSTGASVFRLRSPVRVSEEVPGTNRHKGERKFDTD